MSEAQVRRTVVVCNSEGMHARPAYMFAELAAKFEANVEIIKDNERVDGKSILSIPTLAAEKGTELKIETTGSDAAEALDSLAQHVEDGFPGGEQADLAEPKQGG